MTELEIGLSLGLKALIGSLLTTRAGDTAAAGGAALASVGTAADCSMGVSSEKLVAMEPMLTCALGIAILEGGAESLGGP